MPAMLDDPSSPTIFRTSGAVPYPTPHDPRPLLPQDVYPRTVTLRDRVTTATIIPFPSRHQVPATLLSYLSDQLNKEIAMGDTYPMLDGMDSEKFANYWFQNFGAIMLLGTIENAEDLVEGSDWSVECLGSYYIKPNYPGRSSHVCNAGFLVTDAARNRGVGRLMGESYLEWAPRLGYSYSVFNLVYETNVASCRIWDALGFKRIGRVKGAGNLKSYPGQLVDAIIYGRDLGPEGEDFVSEERFDKIKFYLKYGKYPAGADRAEKSRLRSAATHYKLELGQGSEPDKLMLKDKEVISDPQRQYEIARHVHMTQHGGINKTTATIAEKYHWVRIKETVSLVIKNCVECKELGKAPVVRAADGVIRPATRSTNPSTNSMSTNTAAVSAAGRILSLSHQTSNPHAGFEGQAGQGSVSPQVLNRTLPQATRSSHLRNRLQDTSYLQQSAPVARMQNDYMPLDPQILESEPQMLESVRNHLGAFNHTSQNSHHSHFTTDDQHEPDSFHAMLTSDGRDTSHDHHNDDQENEDLDMLINHDDDEGVEGGGGGNTSIAHLQSEVGLRVTDQEMRTRRQYGGD